MPKTILLLLCTWCALYGIADELGQRQVMQRNWRLNFLHYPCTFNHHYAASCRIIVAKAC